MKEASTLEGKHNSLRASIGIRQATKDKLDKNRAPGQSYDGFLRQLIDMWEEAKKARQEYIFDPVKVR